MRNTRHKQMTQNKQNLSLYVKSKQMMFVFYFSNMATNLKCELRR